MPQAFFTMGKFKLDPFHDAFFEVLATINFSYSEIKSLVALSGCSKAMRAVIRAIIKQDICSFLPCAVKAAAASAASDPAKQPHKKPFNAVLWLCNAAGHKALRTLTATMLHVPRVPAVIVQMLQRAGLQISSAQLIAAARSRVPGVEVWVQDHRSGCSAIEEAICCNNLAELKLLLPFLPPEDLPSMLHLAVNMKLPLPPRAMPSEPSAAEFLLAYMVDLPQQLQQLQRAQQAQVKSAPSQRRRGIMVPHKGTLRLPPPVKQLREEHRQQQEELKQHFEQLGQQLSRPLVEELMLTAAARGNSNLINRLSALAAVREVSLTTATPMLQHAVAQRNLALLQTACSSIGPALLDRETVLGVLQAAVLRQFHEAIPLVTRLPGAAAQVPPKALVSLLQAAVELNAHPVVNSLCQLPAAANISSRSIIGLLETVVEVGSGNVYARNSVSQLVLLPASELISSQAAVGLLQKAMQHKRLFAFQKLLQLPALTQHVQQDDLCHLLKLAAAVDENELYLPMLLQHSAVQQQLTPEMLVTVLQAVMPAMAAGVAAARAGMLGEDSDDEFAPDASAAFSSFLDLPAAAALTASQVEQLLQSVVYHGLGSAAALDLAMLPGGQQLSGQQLANLLLQLLHTQHPGVLGTAERLCSGLVAARQQLDGATVASILAAAVDASRQGPLSQLLHLFSMLLGCPAAQEMPPPDLLSLLQKVLLLNERFATEIAIQGLGFMDSGINSQLLRPLCALTPAATLSVESVARLFQLAVKMQLSASAWTALMSLKAVQELPPTASEQLLQQAMQQLCSSRASTPSVLALQALCKIPSAHQISSAAASNILGLAFQLPDRMEDLLGAAVYGGLERRVIQRRIVVLKGVCDYCQLAAVQQLPADSTATFCNTAIRLAKSSMVLQLTQLQAAQQLDTVAVYGLLELAIQLSKAQPLVCLCTLPAAKQLEAPAIASLARTAVRVGSDHEIWYYIMGQATMADGPGLEAATPSLQGAQKLDAAAISELLLEGIRLGRVACVSLLCSTHAAQHGLGADALVGLLQAAVQHRSESLVILCKLAAVQRLSYDRLAPVVEVAEQQGNAGSVQQLSRLLAEAQ